MKNPPPWLWDVIGLGFLILGILGIYRYGISQENLFYVGYLIIGIGYLVLALIK